MSPDPRPGTRYEELLDGGGTALHAQLAAASRATRADLAEQRPAMPSARAEVVAGAAGPLLAGFVLWALRRAEQAGVGRLYFVARDGEVMLRMARHLAPAAGVGVELAYLEGSRRSWVAAGSADGHDRAWWVSLLEREESPTVRDALGWVRLEPERVAAALGRAGLPPRSWDDALDADGRRRLVEVIVGPDVAQVQAAEDRDRAETARDYLGDVGLLSEVPYGIVDGAGHANIGRLLTGLVQTHGGRPPVMECYYGLQGPARPAPGRQPLGYAYDEWSQGRGRQVLDLWVALEMWTAAPHGRVEGYERVAGRAVPVRGELNLAAERWGMPDVRAGLEGYARELAARLPGVEDPWTDVRQETTAAAALFWEHPSPAEVRDWGHYPFEASSQVYPVAQGYSTGQVLRSLREGRPRTRRRGSWPAGTRATASPHLRALHAVIIFGRRAPAMMGRVLGGRRFGRRAAAGTPVALHPDSRSTIERR